MPTSKQILAEIYKILGRDQLSGLAKMPKFTQGILLERLKEKIKC